VLDGKEATTHWIAADAFRRRFPRVLLTPERMRVDAGDVISSGGATTFLTLVIYLTERYGSHDRAVLAAKVMLVDGERRSQLPYVASGPFRDHGDELIHSVQSFMEAHLAAGVSVDQLATYASVSIRTLNRRFRMATGQTPSGYLQRVRIEAAKRLLETTTDPVDHLRARVGYGDPTAFRRAFTRATGLGPDSTGRSTARDHVTRSRCRDGGRMRGRSQRTAGWREAAARVHLSRLGRGRWR
jgi:transcriptional regulator GlxA family with amidase domain